MGPSVWGLNPLRCSKETWITFLRIAPQREGETGHLFPDSSPSLVEGYPRTVPLPASPPMCLSFSELEAEAPAVLNKVPSRAAPGPGLQQEAASVHASACPGHTQRKAKSLPRACATERPTLCSHHTTTEPIHFSESLLDPLSSNMTYYTHFPVFTPFCSSHHYVLWPPLPGFHRVQDGWGFSWGHSLTNLPEAS